MCAYANETRETLLCLFCFLLELILPSLKNKIQANPSKDSSFSAIDYATTVAG